MNGVGNDFVIFDARKNHVALSSTAIQKICNRKNIGCDQLIIIKNSNKADCLMDIYNSDGSKSATCGNATRCVASLIMEEMGVDKIAIETVAKILNCQRVGAGDEISVEMGVPFFEKNSFYFDDLQFFCVDIGNPHAVTFVDEILADEDFFRIGPAIESHPFFPNKTNVEFAKIISDQLIEVRVFERGAGETLACGSGACAVAAAAIKNNFIKSNKVTIRFKGGDLLIEWNGDGAELVMTGGYKKIFSGTIDKNFIKK